MKKTLCVIIALLLLCAVACKGADKPAKKDDPIRIGIVQITTHPALDSCREGFIEFMAENGFVEGENVEYDIQNAQGDQSTLSSIADRFANAGLDLIVAIATPAAQAMAGKITDIPILATAVTDFEVAKLVDSNEVPGGNVSGTSDMNPIAEQIDLLFELFPNAKTVGCIYNGGEDNSVLQAEIAKIETEKRGAAYTEVTVTSTNDIQQAMQLLVTRCDAIYIPTDNTLASAIPLVSEIANTAQIPTICGESNMVIGGGLATLGINYHDLGRQTGAMALKLLVDGADIASLSVEFASGFETAFNSESAKSIGFTIPEKYSTEG